LIIGTTLVYFQHEQEAIPYVTGQEGEWFNIPMWDRLNSHLDFIRDRGMGVYFMFYSDDAESPNRWNIRQKSPEELRLFRYAVARLAPYPIVMWDSGIDISETRPSDWIDWFADWFLANDPWQHPVGSRSGGGSGGHHPKNATFYSDGASTLPKHSTVVEKWASCDVPRAYTDRWREDYRRGGFDSAMIRRAAWEVGLVGGSAVYISGNENDGYLTETYATDLKAAPELGFRNRFFAEEIDSFATLAPHPELITGGAGIVLVANPGREYVAYGWEGGTIGILLSHDTTSYQVRWYNPRTGQLTIQGIVVGGGHQAFSPPFSGDVVLHLKSTDQAQVHESPPFRHFLPLMRSHGDESGMAECNGATTHGNRYRYIRDIAGGWIFTTPIVGSLNAFPWWLLLVVLFTSAVVAFRLYKG
jgi:hypothetical protein